MTKGCEGQVVSLTLSDWQTERSFRICRADYLQVKLAWTTSKTSGLYFQNKLTCIEVLALWLVFTVTIFMYSYKQRNVTVMSILYVPNVVYNGLR